MVALRTGKPVFNTIMGVKKPSGELTWMTVNAVAICSSAKERPRAVVASFHDITAARQLNEQVRASLREKEVLLKEIHHRVKNNLQIISSLLDLQAEQTQDRQALEMFRESRGRVRSMALIHERLYRSEDLARVNFSEYIQHLTNDLYHNYKVSEDDIILDVCVDVPPLAIDMAIPCGLLINELISNALKHAFAHTTEGHLWVALERGLDNTNVLTVADDGCGFPSDIDFRNTNSFGMQLVNTLVEQLHGEIELNTARGTAFTVTFPDLR
jgi:two-component sensor histidine kinase